MPKQASGVGLGIPPRMASERESDEWLHLTERGALSAYSILTAPPQESAGLGFATSEEGDRMGKSVRGGQDVVDDSREGGGADVRDILQRSMRKSENMFDGCLQRVSAKLCEFHTRYFPISEQFSSFMCQILLCTYLRSAGYVLYLRDRLLVADARTQKASLCLARCAENDARQGWQRSTQEHEPDTSSALHARKHNSSLARSAPPPISSPKTISGGAGKWREAIVVAKDLMENWLQAQAHMLVDLDSEVRVKILKSGEAATRMSGAIESIKDFVGRQKAYRDTMEQMLSDTEQVCRGCA